MDSEERSPITVVLNFILTVFMTIVLSMLAVMGIAIMLFP